MADITPSKRAAYRSRALESLRELHKDNRLFPEQQRFMLGLEKALHETQQPRQGTLLVATFTPVYHKKTWSLRN